MICGQITGTSDKVGSPIVDESDLSLKKLDEFHAKLQELQKEKVYISVHITFVLARLILVSYTKICDYICAC